MDLETIINATFKNEIQVKRIRKGNSIILSPPRTPINLQPSQRGI